MPETTNNEDREFITAIGDNGVLYPIEKLDAHVRNVLHLAVSVFLFYNCRLLLQQRAEAKYHSGGLWANTCCTHPRWNESLHDCAHRRLKEEVGFQIPLSPFGKIDYTAQVGTLYENEAAHCFVGHIEDDALPTLFNRDEVQALRWVALPQLLSDINTAPVRYSQWIQIYMQQHFDLIASVANKPLATQIA